MTSQLPRWSMRRVMSLAALASAFAGFVACGGADEANDGASGGAGGGAATGGSGGSAAAGDAAGGSSAGPGDSGSGATPEAAPARAATAAVRSGREAAAPAHPRPARCSTLLAARSPTAAAASCAAEPAPTGNICDPATHKCVKRDDACTAIAARVRLDQRRLRQPDRLRQLHRQRGLRRCHAPVRPVPAEDLSAKRLRQPRRTAAAAR